MLSAGLPLSQAMSILIKQTSNQFLKQSLENVLADIERGENFSTAISRNPKVFSELFIAMVRSGEATGKLDITLSRMADIMEDDYKLMSQIRTALYYPIFILLVMIVVVMIMLIKVVPQLKDIFTQGGAQLPATTRAIFALASGLAHWWWLILIIIIILVTIGKFYLSSPQGRDWYDSLILRIPFLNNLLKSIYINRFCRTLAMLVVGGVPIIQALGIVAEVMNNNVYKKTLKQAGTEVERGTALSTPISKNTYFPPIVSQMILVGEQTGRMADVLKKLGEYYETDTEEKVKGITSLFEPALIIIIGIGVGFVVYSIILPIYQMSQLQM